MAPMHYLYLHVCSGFFGGFEEGQLAPLSSVGDDQSLQLAKSQKIRMNYIAPITRP